MEVTTLVLILAVCAVLAWIVLARGRDFLARNRLLTAVAVLPLQPLLGLGLVALVVTRWDVLEIRGIALGLVAYVNGLVAFALTTAVQDRRLRTRRASGRGPTAPPARRSPSSPRRSSTE